MCGGCEVLRIILALIITLAAVYDDMKRYKISNRIVMVGLAFAVAVNVVDIFLGLSFKCMWKYTLGGFGTFLIMLMAYMVMAVGAADVKLSGVIGLLLGIDVMCKVVVVAFLYTGVVGTICTLVGRSRQVKLVVGKVHTIHMSIAFLLGEAYAILTLYTEVFV